MLRTLTFVAMGQQHGQSAKPVPLVLAAGDKLIDDHLGAVGEIPKLGFPHHKASRRCGGIAIFKGQYRFLRK